LFLYESLAYELGPLCVKVSTSGGVAAAANACGTRDPIRRRTVDQRSVLLYTTAGPQGKQTGARNAVMGAESWNMSPQ